MSLNFDDVSLIFFDFDGVLTDNRVFVNSQGDEYVACSRSDGLAFDALRKLNKPVYILSTEKNGVVAARAHKLNAQCVHGVKNKFEKINSIADGRGVGLESAVYVGNDINDFFAMQACGFSVCPKDSHPSIQEIAKMKLLVDGGKGVARSLLEDVFKLDLIDILYGDQANN